MLFLGDIACPPGVQPRVVGGERVLGSAVAVANLEGDLVEPGEATFEALQVFNAPDVLDALAEWNVGVVSLANNHILDVHATPRLTIDRLAAAGIRAVGAGTTAEEAAAPVMMHVDGQEVMFLAFGWEVIECRAANEESAGVNSLRPAHVLESVSAARERHPDASVVCLMHWDYELELYPQPMHRQLAFRLAEMGVEAVIGCHSHRVQGIEVHRGVPIVYGLGNWFFAQGVYWGGRVRYPAFANEQLAAEWTPGSEEVTCHWFRYSVEGHVVTYTGSESAAESQRVRELTPFAGMSAAEYESFFAANRVQKKLLPMFRRYEHERLNAAKAAFVAGRGHLVRFLAQARA